MSSDEFGRLLHVSGSYIRGIESGNTACAQTFVDACKKPAGEPNGLELSVLSRLANDLQEIVDEETKIEVGRGSERKIRRRKRVAGDVSPLTGEWCAVWQTSRHRGEAVVLETVDIAPVRSRRGTFEMQNLTDSRWLELHLPEGEDEPDHFQWAATCQITVEHWVSGSFESLAAGPRVAGSFRLKLDNFPKAMAGNWLGVSADSEKTFALLVLGRTEKLAKERFARERKAHPQLPFVPTITH